MIGSPAKRPMDTRKKGTWARQVGEVLHATRVKHPSKRTAESNKHEGSRNDVKAKKKWIHTEVKHTQMAQAPPTCT